MGLAPTDKTSVKGARSCVDGSELCCGCYGGGSGQLQYIHPSSMYSFSLVPSRPFPNKNLRKGEKRRDTDKGRGSLVYLLT